MKVLVIGHSKTGTKTMHAALHILGYKVYDYDYNFYHLGKQWLKILSEKGGTKEDFYNMYKDVDATMDVPACNFWEEILEAFPDVKVYEYTDRGKHMSCQVKNNTVITTTAAPAAYQVINELQKLSVITGKIKSRDIHLIFNERDSDEKWLESLEKTWDNIRSNFLLKLMALLSPTARSMFRYCDRIGCVCYGAPPQGWLQIAEGLPPTVAKMMYRNHNARIKEKAPKNQLLVFSPSEGWGPLCGFLEKSVPDREFPHKNKGGTVLDELFAESPVFQRMKYEAVVTFSVLLCLAAFAFMYFIAL